MRRDVEVLDTLVAMQRHADFIRRGYHWWTGGVVEATRALRLVRRFEVLYETNLHRNTRRRRRARGEGASLLLLYRTPIVRAFSDRCNNMSSPLCIGWTLLVSDGDCAARHREALHNARERDTRLVIGPYELVRHNRKHQSHPAWTFRMSHLYYEHWRGRVVRSARGDPHELCWHVLKDLYSEPGFAGVRSQVGHVCALYRREWRRRRNAGDAFPALPRLSYVQRLPTSSTSLKLLLKASGTHTPIRTP